MARQVSDQVSNGLREEVQRFLKARPDVRFQDLVHHTSLTDSTGRNFLNGHCPGGREVVHEFQKALELARAGDILPPGGRPSLVVTAKTKGRTKLIASNQRNF